MAIVKKYRSVIVSLENKIPGVFTLEIASLDGAFKYNPGQFLHLALDSVYDGSGQWPDSRCFSMQSSPGEKHIRITYAVKGRFTELMERQLKTGSEVWLKLPYGDLFQQPHNKQKTVFIAGGTGITPFLSLFTHKSFNDYFRPTIYIGFRSKHFNIYGSDLKHVNNPMSFIKTYYEDEDGVINIDQVYSENGKDSSYFVSGPPAMIQSFKQILILKGVSANNVLSDNWE